MSHNLSPAYNVNPVHEVIIQCTISIQKTMLNKPELIMTKPI